MSRDFVMFTNTHVGMCISFLAWWLCKEDTSFIFCGLRELDRHTDDVVYSGRLFWRLTGPRWTLQRMANARCTRARITRLHIPFTRSLSIADKKEGKIWNTRQKRAIKNFRRYAFKMADREGTSWFSRSKSTKIITFVPFTRLRGPPAFKAFTNFSPLFFFSLIHQRGDYVGLFVHASYECMETIQESGGSRDADSSALIILFYIRHSMGGYMWVEYPPEYAELRKRVRTRFRCQGNLNVCGKLPACSEFVAAASRTRSSEHRVPNTRYAE